jgi:hypothetical protein
MKQMPAPQHTCLQPPAHSRHVMPCPPDAPLQTSCWALSCGTLRTSVPSSSCSS